MTPFNLPPHVQITNSRLIVGLDEYRWHDIIRVDKANKGNALVKLVFSCLFFITGLFLLHASHWLSGVLCLLFALMIAFAKVKNDEVLVIHYRDNGTRTRVTINDTGEAYLYETIRKMHAERG